jgi:hypothetical protein
MNFFAVSTQNLTQEKLLDAVDFRFYRLIGREVPREVQGLWYWQEI